MPSGVYKRTLKGKGVYGSPVIEDRLGHLLTKRNIDENGCWNYIGATNSRGYGHFWNGDRHQGSHRFMYEQKHNIKLTTNQDVCHVCDNPLCFNPDHLFLGDALANVHDAKQKGRMTGAAVTTEQVLEIRELAKIKTQYYIADLLGCSQSFVSRVINNKRRYSQCR